MNISIEPLRADDLQTRDMLLAYLTERWNEPRDGIEQKYVLPSFAGGLPYVFIAFTEDREIAGHVMLAVEEEGYMGINGQPWVYGLYVPETFRSHGIARTLLSTIEEKCREHGYPYLYLDTVSTADYYRRLGGWEDLGTTRWTEKDEEVTIMRKDVSKEI